MNRNYHRKKLHKVVCIFKIAWIILNLPYLFKINKLEKVNELYKNKHNSTDSSNLTCLKLHYLFNPFKSYTLDPITQYLIYNRTNNISTHNKRKNCIDMQNTFVELTKMFYLTIYSYTKDQNVVYNKIVRIIIFINSVFNSNFYIILDLLLWKNKKRFYIIQNLKFIKKNIILSSIFESHNLPASRPCSIQDDYFCTHLIINFICLMMYSTCNIINESLIYILNSYISHISTFNRNSEIKNKERLNS
ncbi:hypothetical protein AGLY_010176 [Aphis glycines]|uniref:Uncharacterized protein n=1 Tax=Aphis glycines TaxID=307491 RepID=A0A6G0THG4_APHGL|nr:hypothetical protein AGLY_010176 [Aphis glycines]